MSALGQMRTFALHQSMSALPLIATAKATFHERSCLLYPQKQTCAVQLGMSALGQKRTHALQQSMLGLGQALTLAEKLRNVIIAARWP